MVHEVRRVNHDRAQRAHRLQRRVERGLNVLVQRTPGMKEPPRHAEAHPAQRACVQGLRVVRDDVRLHERVVIARVRARYRREEDRCVCDGARHGPDGVLVLRDRDH